MAYDTTEAVAKFLSGFQMEITHRGKGTFTPDHVKYSLTIANGGKDFSTTFESNPHVHGVLRRDEAVCRHPRLQLLQGDLRLDA